MTRRLPPLSALRLFEAAGRCGSYVAAAAEQGVTPSAISHAIRTLEDSIGEALFRRGPGGPSLTAAGRELQAEATAAFDRIGAVTRRISASRADKGLVVSATPTFAARWLMPRLPELQRIHPALRVTIGTEQQRVEPSEGGCDLAIRMAREAPSGSDWKLLGRERLVPLAAPHVLRRLPEGGLEAALRVLPLIHVTTIPEEWEAWPGIATREGRRGGGLRFDTQHMALDAAAQGLGIVLGRLPLAGGDIGAGRLVMLSEPIAAATGYWLVPRHGLLRQRDARQFVGWLQSRFSADLAD